MTRRELLQRFDILHHVLVPAPSTQSSRYINRSSIFQAHPRDMSTYIETAHLLVQTEHRRRILLKHECRAEQDDTDHSKTAQEARNIVLANTRYERRTYGTTAQAGPRYISWMPRERSLQLSPSARTNSRPTCASSSFTFSSTFTVESAADAVCASPRDIDQ